MVAEQEVTYKLDLSLQKCPACGSNSRWDPRFLGEVRVGESKFHIFCDCGMGILEIELVK